MASSRYVCLFFISFMVIIVVAEGSGSALSYPKRVTCKNKNYPDCYHEDLYCPEACSRKCVVDCALCQPVCLPEPPKRVKCHDKNYPRCYQKTFNCPADCPHWCFADCASCKPVCTAPSPPPEIVECENENYPDCKREFLCPSTCPKTCEVDCEKCQPFCPQSPWLLLPPDRTRESEI